VEKGLNSTESGTRVKCSMEGKKKSRFSQLKLIGGELELRAVLGAKATRGWDYPFDVTVLIGTP